ncbi:hypothetical protein OE88DRAFT_1666395, partial [Heliocybe sulcata]
MSTPQAPSAAMLEQDRPPSHRVHGSEDPVPGARGVAPAADYSAEATEHWNDRGVNAESAAAAGMPRSQSGQGQTAFEDDRPLGTQPVSGGGVAIDGNEDKPMGKAGVADKIVGKTQKVVGKYTHKPELHEKGELRESGGKAAAQGEARAPH